jgi:hypothetical protein
MVDVVVDEAGNASEQAVALRVRWASKAGLVSYPTSVYLPVWSY